MRGNRSEIVFATAMPTMVTVKELAQETKRFGVSENHIRTALKQGKFPYVRIGRKTLINRDKFIEYLNGTVVK